MIPPNKKEAQIRSFFISWVGLLVTLIYAWIPEKDTNSVNSNPIE